MHKLSVLLTIAFMIGLAACSNNTSNDKTNTGNSENKMDTTADNTQRKVIVFFGNSLSAGYGVELNEAFPALIQQRLDSLGYAYEVINAGVSGETTATGNSRVDWVASQYAIDIFVLELGGNDGLRGIPSVETQKNLESIIDKVRSAHPNVTILLAGMMVPPNMGQAYSKGFQEVFPAVAKAKNTVLIPFLLENVGGVDSLNLPDGIHPTPAGHVLVRENVWEVLKNIVQKPV